MPKKPIAPVPAFAWLRNGLALFALLAAIVALGAWPIVRAYDSGRIEIIEAREHGYADAAALDLRGMLREVAGDLQVMANLPATRRYLDQPGREQHAAVADAFRNTLEAYERYDAVRLVDTGGRELVRVADDHGQPADATDAQRQLAVDDAAVAAAAALERGGIDIAPLGAANGPLLRASTPVFDAAGNRRGVLVVNLRAADMLRRFQELTAAEPQHEAFLLDAGGSALGAEAVQAGFAGAYPREWAVIAAGDRASIRSANGLFVSATVAAPASAGATAVPASARAPAPVLWKVVLRLSHEKLFERSPLRLPLGRLLFATIYVLLLLLSLLLAYSGQQRERAREAERVAARDLRDLYERAPCGYHSLDRDGVVVRMNQTELDWLGYRRDELVGRMKITELMTDSGRATFAQRFPQLMHSDQLGDTAFDLVRKDGSLLPVVVNATVVRDEKGEFLMTRSTVFDATERRKLEQELLRQARTDVLTGIGNRRHFFEFAAHELARSARSGSPLSLLLLDIDEFKQINDTHGHDAGDAALKAMAAACGTILRESDLFARVGGEEFAVLLPDSDAGRASAIAERLRAQVASLALALADGTTLRLTVSIGVAVLEPADGGIDPLFKRADLALFRAKAAGRNRVCMARDDAVPA